MSIVDVQIRRFIEAVVHGAMVEVAGHDKYIGTLLGRCHSHPNLYQISYVLKGVSRVLIGNRHYMAGEGDLLLIPPSQLHASDPANMPKKFELLQIKFSLSHCLPLPLPAYMQMGCPTILLTLFYSIISEFHMRRPRRAMTLQLDLARLILFVISQRQKKSNGLRLILRPDPVCVKDAMERVIHHIMANYSRKLPLPELVRMAGYSAGRFGHLFQSYTGTSPVRYLINYRLAKALEMMTRSDKKLADIASETGFSSVYYFSRLFQKHYHQSPRRYAHRVYNSR